MIRYFYGDSEKSKWDLKIGLVDFAIWFTIFIAFYAFRKYKKIISITFFLVYPY
jgi:hypothetical protein